VIYKGVEPAMPPLVRFAERHGMIQSIRGTQTAGDVTSMTDHQISGGVRQRLGFISHHGMTSKYKSTCVCTYT
jgi:hypothetical protein